MYVCVLKYYALFETGLATAVLRAILDVDTLSSRFVPIMTFHYPNKNVAHCFDPSVSFSAIGIEQLLRIIDNISII